MRIAIQLKKDVADRAEAITLFQQVRKKLESYPAISVTAIIVDPVDVSALPDPPA